MFQEVIILGLMAALWVINVRFSEPVKGELKLPGEQGERKALQAPKAQPLPLSSPAEGGPAGDVSGWRFSHPASSQHPRGSGSAGNSVYLIWGRPSLTVGVVGLGQRKRETCHFSRGCLTAG